MARCPECGDTVLTNDGSEEKYSQEDEFTTVIETYYTCDCGCEFTVTETTTTKTEITRSREMQP